MRYLFERLIAAFRLPSVDEAEREYLNGAYDQINLEYRQRQIDLGLFRRAHTV